MMLVLRGSVTTAIYFRLNGNTLLTRVRFIYSDNADWFLFYFSRDNASLILLEGLALGRLNDLMLKSKNNSMHNK